VPVGKIHSHGCSALVILAALAVCPIAYAAERPSFLVSGDVFCPDELDFNSFVSTGKINTRGVLQSCSIIDRLTRVVVISGDQGKAMVRMINGPFQDQVGFSNGSVPSIGSVTPAPAQP